MKERTIVFIAALVPFATSLLAVNYDLANDAMPAFDVSVDSLANTTAIAIWDASDEGTQLKVADYSDFSGIDFAALGMTTWISERNQGVDFTGANFSGITISINDHNLFASAVLVNANFQGATINNPNNQNQPFLDTNLTGADFSGATINIGTVSNGPFRTDGGVGSLKNTNFSNVTWGGTWGTPSANFLLNFFNIGPGTTSTADAASAVTFAGADLSIITGDARTAMMNNLGRFDGATPIGAFYDDAMLEQSTGWLKSELDAAGWQYIPEPDGNGVIVVDSEFQTTVSALAPSGASTTYSVDSQGNVVFDSGSGATDTGLGLGDWVLPALTESEGFAYAASGGVAGSGGFVAATGNGEPRAILQFTKDDKATTGRVSLLMDVYFDDYPGDELYLMVDLLAWNSGDEAPALTAAGTTSNHQGYTAWERGDAVSLIDQAKVYARDFASGAWSTATIQSTVNLGSGYDYYAWRIGVVGAEAADEFAFDNIQLGEGDPIGTWMSGTHGVGWRINADDKPLIENFGVEAFVNQIASVPGVSYVICNLSDPAYGDSYIAPHSVLTAITPSSTPDNDRDLFGELVQAFKEKDIKVIAYMASQGPAMLKHGPKVAHDGVQDADTGVWTAQSVDNWLAWVLANYGANDEETLKQAYAEVIVAEYAERYGPLIDGWWFDNGTEFNNAPLLDLHARRYNPNASICFNSATYQNNNFSSGHPYVVSQVRVSNDLNRDYLIHPIERGGGFIEQKTGIQQVGHVFMPMQVRWNQGNVVWYNENETNNDLDKNGLKTDDLTSKAVAWMNRTMNAGGAWTWNLDMGDEDYSVDDGDTSNDDLIRSDAFALWSEIVSRLDVDPVTPPEFTLRGYILSDGTFGLPYTGTMAGSASDVDGDSLTYEKLVGADWLTVSLDGTLTGTPDTSSDIGMNRFTILVSDGTGYIDLVELEIYVDGLGQVPTRSIFFDNLNSDDGGKINDGSVDLTDYTITHQSDGDDFIISIAVQDVTLDAIGTDDDSISWDIRVEGFVDGSYTLNGNDSSVTLGTPVKVYGEHKDYGLEGSSGSNQHVTHSDTIRFTVENIVIDASPGTTAEFGGFTSIWSLTGTYILGEGSGLEALVDVPQGDVAFDSPQELVLTVASAIVRVRELAGEMIIRGNSAPYFRANYVPVITLSDNVLANDLSGLSALALDDDGMSSELVYTLLSGPSWLSIDSSGKLSGTPGASDISQPEDVVIQVTDAYGASDTLVLELGVVLSPDLQIHAGSQLSLNWDMQAGVIYDLYKSTDLSEGFELHVADIQSGSFVETPEDEDVQCFYYISLRYQ